MDFPTIYTALNGIRARASPRARRIQLPGLGKLDQMFYLEIQTGTDHALKPGAGTPIYPVIPYNPQSSYTPPNPRNRPVHLQTIPHPHKQAQ